jgi:uncharacterized membrane protein
MSSHVTRWRNVFFAGLLTTVPIVASVGIIGWIFNLLTGQIPRVLNDLPIPLLHDLLQNRFATFGIRILSLMLIVFAIYLVGLFARNVIGRRLIDLLEEIFRRLPMVGGIHSTVKQMGSALLNGGGTGMFRQVALLEYPKEECYAIGFVTAVAPVECSERKGTDLVSVFLPTTPNPTSGYLLLLPRHKVTILQMSVAEGMRLIISGGVVKPSSDLEIYQKEVTKL